MADAGCVGRDVEPVQFGRRCGRAGDPNEVTGNFLGGIDVVPHRVKQQWVADETNNPAALFGLYRPALRHVRRA
jgi:hypothetical protein